MESERAMEIDPIIYSGRPNERRTDREERCYELLEKLGIEYLRADHEHADSIEQCEAVEKLLGAEICKNLLLTNRQMTAVYLLLMPGRKPFKTKILSKQIGTSRLSFATAEQMLELLDLYPGSVSIMGLMNDRENKVHLLIDKELLQAEDFACHPCMNTSTLRFKTSDMTDKLIPALGHEVGYVDLPWNTDEL